MALVCLHLRQLLELRVRSSMFELHYVFIGEPGVHCVKMDGSQPVSDLMRAIKARHLDLVRLKWSDLSLYCAAPVDLGDHSSTVDAAAADASAHTRARKYIHRTDSCVPLLQTFQAIKLAMTKSKFVRRELRLRENQRLDAYFDHGVASERDSDDDDGDDDSDSSCSLDASDCETDVRTVATAIKDERRDDTSSKDRTCTHRTRCRRRCSGNIHIIVDRSVVRPFDQRWEIRSDRPHIRKISKRNEQMWANKTQRWK